MPLNQNIENKLPPAPAKQEEKKRPQWNPPAAEKKKDSSEDDEEEGKSPMYKQKKKEDWNYLKQTISMAHGEQLVDPQLLTFHEKVDKIVEEEEELLNKHL
mmetsp:Transcript_43248/g.31582  ORF Transcript_43248/g.31582 Transcript_43248/m.31582 type:complete len:101 (+) Transcript_43248:1189-1491(+)